MLFLEDLHEVLHDTLIEVVTTQMYILVCCHHLENPVVKSQR